MASTAEDQARLLVTIEVNQRKIEQQMARIAKAAGDGATSIEKNYQKANDNVSKGFERGSSRATASVGQVRASVTNLSFQLNDIAMGLASGTSPFTIMVQQGSQVAQALQGAGGGLVGAVRALGGAFASMVNPVSLASFALIGLTGAAVSYFTTLGGETPDATELLKQHADVIRSFDEAYGIAEKGVKRYTEAARNIEFQKLKDEYGSLQAALQEAAKPIAHPILQLPASDFGSGKLIDEMNRAITLLERDVPAVREFADEMIRIENTKGIPENIRAIVREMRLSAQAVVPLQDAIEGVTERLGVVRLTAGQAKSAFEAITSAALGLGDSGKGAIDKLTGGFTSGLIPAIESAITKFAEFAKNYNSLQKQLEQSPLGTIGPVYSGGGSFLDPMQLQNFKFDQAQYEEAGKSAAAAMIRGFEKFSAKAYPDTRSSTGEFDAWRTGFGSDTVTRANGTIEKVTQATIVTLDDAERDLSRRLIEFQNGIQNAIGVDTWRSLNEGQKAALSSIAYNYGSLPKSIVAAINSGGGPELVAQAIAKLTANPARRKEEAQAYLSGTGYSLKDAGISTGSRKRTPEDIFKGDIQQVEKRIAVMNAEYEAQARLNPLVKDYGYAVAKAKIEQQLLSEAQAAGLTITPELASQISKLAENYAKAEAATGRLAEKQKQTTEAAQFFKETFAQAFMDMIPDIETGNEALDRFLNTLIEAVAQAALLGQGPLAGLFGGGTGLLGALLPGLRLASGGRVSGPGGPKDDRIPAMLSNGEYVVNARSAQKNAALLEAINSGRAIKLAGGGPIGSAPVLRVGGGAGGGQVTVRVIGEEGPMFRPTIQAEAQGVSVKVVQAGIGQYDKNLDRTWGSRSMRAQQRQL